MLNVVLSKCRLEPDSSTATQNAMTVSIFTFIRHVILDWNDYIVAKLQPVFLIYAFIFYNRDVSEFLFLTSKDDGLHNFLESGSN